MEYEKDYSLLRAFDMEAAKAGELLCGVMGIGDYTLIAGPNSDGAICATNDKGNTFWTGLPEFLRLSPLAWVEGKPVYKGDRLFHDCGPCVVIGTPIREDHDLRIKADGVILESDAQIPCLTWTPPKVKREGFVYIVKSKSLSGNFMGEFPDVAVRNAFICPTHEAAKVWVDQCGDVIAIA